MSQLASIHDEQNTIETHGELFKKIKWRLLPFLFAAFCMAYLDRINVAFAKLQMANELQFSDAVYGLGAGIFFAGYFLFEVPSNLILERVGARLWIARIMITWGVLSCAMALVTTPTGFYITRFLLGVAEAGFAPGIYYLFTKWFPNRHRGRVYATFFAVFPTVGILGGPLSGYLIDALHGAGGWSGWRWMFFIEGLPAILLGFLCLYILQDGPEKAHWLSAEEKAALFLEIAADPKPEEQGTFLMALRRPTIWLLCCINFAVGAGFLGVGFWMPTILKEAGFASNTMIGLVSAIPYAFAFIGVFAVGWSADYKKERRYHLALPLILGAVGLIVAANASASPVLIVVGLSLGMAGVTSASPMVWPLSMALISAEARAGATAMITSALALAGFVMPYIVGVLRGVDLGIVSGSALGLFIIAGVMVSGGLIAFAFPAAKVNV